MNRRAPALALLAITLAGCGGGVSASNHPAAQVATHATVPSSPSPRPLTADSVLTGLDRHGMPATLCAAYTASTDPNHLLGRPNGYTSKVAFTDPRISQQYASSDPGGIENGGGVEVYPTAAGALARAQYIQGIAAHSSLLDEYDYVSGGAVLRLSTSLTPAQAQQYAGALRTVTGLPVREITGS